MRSATFSQTAQHAVRAWTRRTRDGRVGGGAHTALACTGRAVATLSRVASAGTVAPFLKAITPDSAGGAATPSSHSGAYMIHTGYGTAPGTSSFSSSVASDSYAVVDAQAFEAAVAAATHATVEEVSLPAAHTPTARGRAEAPTTERVAVLAHTALSRHWLSRHKADKARLQALLDKKAPIDRYVDNLFYPALKYGCFALLALQLGVYFNWIFFVFDWNLMEPTTYFLAYTGVYASLVYHYVRCGRDDFTWKNLFVYWADRERESMCRKDNLDLVELASLQQRVDSLASEVSKYELKD